MKKILTTLCLLWISTSIAQSYNDYLPASFHKERRELLRSKMPKNSVAVVFSNPIRNRSNDVDYIFHQSPNFYYLTGLREANSVLILYSENQTDKNGKTFNEVLYLPKKTAKHQLWHGEQMGVEGAKTKLGFSVAKTTEEFLTDNFTFKKFDKIFVEKFEDDYRNSEGETTEIYDLVAHFKKQSGYNALLLLSMSKERAYKLIESTPITNFEKVVQVINNAKKYYPSLNNDETINGYISAQDDVTKKVFQEKAAAKLNSKSKINVLFLPTQMATMREIKTPEELKLLTKAIKISSIGHIEAMKALRPNMSEIEVQGVHEIVYNKYKAEDNGYPPIVGAGNNGCILHYNSNDKETIHANELVLMDVGAQYRGYSADITRTIPTNGKFSPEQKAIYELVLKAQMAGIEACRIGNPFWEPGKITKKIINQGLYELGITKSTNEKHTYFPHGTSHHIGLDVHDPSNFGKLKENMIITVEPGIYIPEGSNCDKKWWGIAVRIEDDILITNGGPKNLSEDAPKTVKAIEKMMAKKSIFDHWKLPKVD